MCAFTGAACERENVRDVHVSEPCRSCHDDDDFSPERARQHGGTDSAPNGSAMTNGHLTSLDRDVFARAAEDNSAGEREGGSDEIQFEECQHGEWMLACDECLGCLDAGQNGLVDPEEGQGEGAS
ncbi:hypothetical protein NU219Hw_g3817t1 [Hortaea werneckii]